MPSLIIFGTCIIMSFMPNWMELGKFLWHFSSDKDRKCCWEMMFLSLKCRRKLVEHRYLPFIILLLTHHLTLSIQQPLAPPYPLSTRNHPTHSVHPFPTSPSPSLPFPSLGRGRGELYFQDDLWDYKIEMNILKLVCSILAWHISLTHISMFEKSILNRNRILSFSS